MNAMTTTEKLFWIDAGAGEPLIIHLTSGKKSLGLVTHFATGYQARAALHAAKSQFPTDVWRKFKVKKKKPVSAFVEVVVRVPDDQ
jgi:hypothetical protein